MKVHVQFFDATESQVIAVFGCPQDPETYENQGLIDEADVRYVSFVDPSRTDAGKWARLQDDATTRLRASDITVLRCVESGIKVPDAWVAYRRKLREIVGAESGDPTQGLPDVPAFPAGT